MPNLPESLFPIGLDLTNQLQCLWNPEVEGRLYKCSPIIYILSRIKPISRIVAYFLKLHSNTAVSSMLRISQSSVFWNCNYKLHGNWKRRFNVQTKAESTQFSKLVPICIRFILVFSPQIRTPRPPLRSLSCKFKLQRLITAFKNNPYPQKNQSNFPMIYSYIVPRGLFPMCFNY